MQYCNINTTKLKKLHIRSYDEKDRHIVKVIPIEGELGKFYVQYRNKYIVANQENYFKIFLEVHKEAMKNQINNM